MIIAALPEALTATVAVAALIGGIIVALLSPVILKRLSAKGAGQSDTLPVFWGKLFVCEIIASLLLYSGSYSFHVLPPLPSVMKVVSVLVVAIVLTTLFSLLLVRRSAS